MISMANGRTCVELCIDALNKREMARLRELEIKDLTLSELLRLELIAMRREAVQRRVRTRLKRPLAQRV